jgi:hypothetical protein
MGAGCYYTNKYTKEVAYWVSPDCDTSEWESWEWEQFKEDIVYLIEEATKFRHVDCRGNLKMKSNLHSLTFEPTYYGDALVIQIAPILENHPIYNIAMANLNRVEAAVARAVNKSYPLFYATSGHTAHKIEKGAFK